MLLLHTPFLRGYPPFSNSGLLRMKHITIYFWLNEHLVFFFFFKRLLTWIFYPTFQLEIAGV